MISPGNVGLARILKNICQLQMVIAKLKNMAMTLLMIHKIHIDLFHVQKLNADIMFIGRYTMTDILIRGYKAREQIEDLIKEARYGANNSMIGSGLEIVELPPHGDLIDRDAILKAERNKPISKMMMFGGTYVYDESVINDAPVVVPAERSEDE